MPSCAAPPGFSRQSELRAELKSIEDYERRAKGTTAAQQLALALQDARYELRTEGGCWADDEIALAKKHVEMTKEDVQNGLRRLNVLARKLQGSTERSLELSPDESGSRYLAKHIIKPTRPLCSVSSEQEDEYILAPARHAVERFKKSLDGTRIAIHFAIAEADFAYERSITMAECGEPSRREPDQLRSEALEAAQAQIATAARKIAS